MLSFTMPLVLTVSFSRPSPLPFSPLVLAEWTTHGTCSGLGQHAYFAAALDLLLPTPRAVREHYGATVRRADLAGADGYRGGDATVLVCRSAYLAEVRACFEKGADGAVGERVACPGPTLAEDSCGEEIRIAAFDAGATTALA